MRTRYYYRQLWAPEGKDPNALEKGLDHNLESKCGVILDRLIAAPEQLTDDDTACLLNYLEWQRIRVPRQAEINENLARQGILKAIASKEVILSFKDSARFDFMKDLSGLFLPWFGRMEWEVVTAGDEAVFITTDNPVSFFNSAVQPPAEPGIALAGTVVLFPLSSPHALLMRHNEYKLDIATPLRQLVLPTDTDDDIVITSGAIWSRKQVESFNEKLVRQSSRFLVAENRSALERCMAA